MQFTFPVKSGRIEMPGELAVATGVSNRVGGIFAESYPARYFFDLELAVIKL